MPLGITETVKGLIEGRAYGQGQTDPITKEEQEAANSTFGKVFSGCIVNPSAPNEFGKGVDNMFIDAYDVYRSLINGVLRQLGF